MSVHMVWSGVMSTFETAKRLILVPCLLSVSLFLACSGGSESGTGGDVASTDMLEGRGQHTSTLLSDGRLLVAGGRAELSLSSSEIYDPVPNEDPEIGHWTASGQMAEERLDHTAITLGNGLVLVVGGDRTGHGRYRAPASLTTAELYDPANGSWSSTGSTLHQHGGGHSATLLQNGKVLLAGGLFEELSTSDSARAGSRYSELYDPATGTWAQTGDLSQGRAKHKSVLLEDGNVLLMGSKSTEMYSVKSGTWSKAKDMPNNHGVQFTATRLHNGSVLVIGGGIVTTVSGVETSAPAAVTHVDMYEPSSGDWSSVSNLNTAESGHTSTLLPDGRVLVVGTVSAQIYDPASDSWDTAGEMSITRGAPILKGPPDAIHKAVLMNDGTVLITGGADLELSKYGVEIQRTGITEIDKYNPATGWE